ncbi:acetolactate synthase [Conexibacter woesei]|uniref:Thiamine pyrophosphate protein TPP binding domain protein n=1 Tax=Conexibacter woesei (strain DSM 14684 / CCUG 47730 / CIP 108061 / JCM 11494 / NBRC 100937 / ID131577) TaxID=469383 RepID=D3FEC4_CONWI|nr:acetolactate synthase [Conexibacter woesei]ADB53616.1 thiamine pyrophosphate protein TPP binding domain protein [Conexibacter woesei DSM 14684]
MSTDTQQETRLHGGRLIARRLKAHGVTKLFTLSGGHIFPIYDGCRAEGIDIVDVRHEQAAAFAAEGWAKVTRTPGVAAVTAGPGVTNAMSAIASAQSNNSPVLVLGGRAPALRWGRGSLQEIDHVPFVRPLTKLAATPDGTAEIPGLVDDALRVAMTPHSGPAFLDFAMDHVFSEAQEPASDAALLAPHLGPGADGNAIERAGALLAQAERPVIMAGTNLYWGHGEAALRALAEQLGVPVFLNGLARGCVPADHELFFSRARGAALKGADVALVIGVPMDFRLGFGESFGAETELISIDVAEPVRDHPRTVAAELYGALPATLDALREAAAGGPDRTRWHEQLRAVEEEKHAAEALELNDERAPLHPMRVYKGLAEVIDRNAIVVCDGGDFVSYAGRVVDSYEPGCWLDPGPFGCLGTGPGYALAAKIARPERQVVLLLGDGAFGFSGLEFDTLARHGVNVVGVMGNNGIWALEKHPMEFLYGYSVAAELRPGTRYDEVVGALGGHGELVERPEQLRGALDRAFSAGVPALVNVLTDPTVVYPRKSNLA